LTGYGFSHTLAVYRPIVAKPLVIDKPVWCLKILQKTKHMFACKVAVHAQVIT